MGNRDAAIAGACLLFATGCCDRPEPNPYDHKGPYAQVSLGGTHTCVRDTAGKASCWKYGPVATAKTPNDAFALISTGGNEACGIRADGTIACWGNCLDHACEPPPGAYVAVTLGEYGGGCALDAAGRVHCWGIRTISPKGVFAQIDYGAGAVCGVAPDRRVSCWGLLEYSTSGPDGGMHAVSMHPPLEVQGRVLQVDVGRDHACAVLDDESIACWGDDTLGQASPPAGRFKKVVATRERSCALGRKGEVACWGPPISWMHRVYAPPAGPFVDLGLGDSHACALRADRTMTCWGVDQQSQVSGKRWMLIRN